MFLRSFSLRQIGAIALFATLTVATSALADPVKVGDLEITNAWARATPPGAHTAAAYLTVTNAGTTGDTLTAASAPIAGLTMLHKMEMQDGVMKMRMVDGGIAIAPGKTVTLDPNGLHVMMMDVTEPLKAGGTLPLTLTFAKAGTVTVTMPILPVGSKGPDAAAPAKMDDMSGMDMGKPKGN
jgi:periplasmic copper chaperone A